MTAIVALGAGRMGRGIAQVFATAGHDVTILDFKDRPADDAEELLDTAKAEVAENLAFLQSLDVIDVDDIDIILARVHLAANDAAPDLLAKAEFIFEGVPETLEAKKDAIARASELAGDDTIIASTSSTMLPEELAGFSVRPNHFLNAHFLNPAYLIPLVEVSPGDAADVAVQDRLMALLEEIGKTPVICRHSPGYIVARLQCIAMNEAVRMVEEGIATAEDIDRAVRTGFGIRYATMGLIEFTDWGGVDILYYASNYLSRTVGDRFAAPEILGKLMERGDLGLKTGKGIYDFADTDTDAYRREKLSTFVDLLRHLDLMPVDASGKRIS